jgi:phage shock protein A
MPITKNIDVITSRMHQMEDVNIVFAKFTGQSEVWRDKTQREMDQIWDHAQQAERDHVSIVETAAFARGRQDATDGRLDRMATRVDKLGERTYQAKP